MTSQISRVKHQFSTRHSLGFSARFVDTRRKEIAQRSNNEKVEYDGFYRVAELSAGNPPPPTHLPLVQPNQERCTLVDSGLLACSNNRDDTTASPAKHFRLGFSNVFDVDVNPFKSAHCHSNTRRTWFHTGLDDWVVSRLIGQMFKRKMANLATMCRKPSGTIRGG